MREDETRRVSMMLLGAQPVGTLVLVHIDTAIRVLDALEAKQIDDALKGLEAAMRGENFEIPLRRPDRPRTAIARTFALGPLETIQLHL